MTRAPSNYAQKRSNQSTKNEPSVTNKVVSTSAGVYGSPFASSNMILLFEMIAGAVIITVAIVRTGGELHFETYLWWMLLWWLLALLAMYEPAKPAISGLGGLVLVTVLVKYGTAAFTGKGTTGAGAAHGKSTVDTYDPNKETGSMSNSLDPNDHPNASVQPDNKGGYNIVPNY